MPAPLAYTRVLAVPRSIARSLASSSLSSFFGAADPIPIPIPILAFWARNLFSTNGFLAQNAVAGAAVAGTTIGRQRAELAGEVLDARFERARPAMAVPKNGCADQ